MPHCIAANMNVVDVDGSYLYKKNKTVTDAGHMHMLAPKCPNIS